ncbi:MAG: leucine-rich repeat protein [Ruminococcus sp.]|nr:leucine-rich repeat protein [Ruminococcus sp.]
MSKENNKRRIREITAFAAALIMVGAFSLPSGTEIMGVSLGSAVVASAASSGDFGENNSLHWELDDEGTLTISGTGKMPSWSSSSSYPWNGNKESIKSVVIDNGVTSIGKNAFFLCNNLTSINIPISVTSIEESALQGCTNLTSINIPDSVKSIGKLALQGCNNLISINIPSSVTSIGNGVFSNCSSLSDINVEPGNTMFSSESGVLFDKNKTKLIKYPINKSGDSYDIPNSVTSIGAGAFANCNNLASITIPSSVTAIENDAFAHCKSIASITIPDSVNSIGYGAFYNCTSLSEVTIPDSVDSIGDSAFYNCTRLTSITIPDSVNSIGESTFSGCTSLTSITIPDRVTSIGIGAFSGCTSLTSITIPNSVTSIGDFAFGNCTSLTSITIPDSVNSIGYGAFYGCTSLKSIFLPDSLFDIGEDAIPTSATQIKYTVETESTVINKVTLGSDPTGCSLPTTLFEKPVFLADYCLKSCPTVTHDHRAMTEATCKAKAICAICLQSYGSTLPHTLTSVEAHSPTCTTNGNIQHWRCNTCSKLFYDEDGQNEAQNVIVPATGHNLGHTEYVSPTCTESGNKEYWSCSNCNMIFEDEAGTIEFAGDTFIEKTGHSWSTTWENDVDCHWHKCQNTGCTEIKDKAEHSSNADATETTAEVCKDCGYVMAPALGHIHKNHLTPVAEVPETCTTDGVKAHYKCDCGKLFADDQAETEVTLESLKIAAHHSYGTEWVSDNDKNHYHLCSVCGDKADVTDHSYDDGVITTPATEQAEGAKTYTCEDCGYEKTESIAKLNHTHKPSEEYSKDETGHWHDCSGCTEKVGFESHDFDEGIVTTEPTEETEGVKTFTCKDCGYTKTETIPVTEPSIPETPEEKVNSFVERLYENVLGRPSDPSKETHIDNLNEGKTATKVAYDFVFSPEFTELDISNEERVTIMYNTFLNRDPDPAGLETWTKALDNGCSIGHIFYGFTQSGEFGEICDAYGIEQGTWEYVENRDKSAELTAFVSRLYTKALNRTYDVNGLNDHTGTYLENHDLYQMAYNFIFSPEFMDKNLSDEEFVDTMYRTFFDREADPDGKADWLDRMSNQGYSREDVLAGFVGSQECVNLVAKFGI